MASDIYIRIRENIKVAMKAKDASQVSCLRLLDSEIQNEALKTRKEISDDMVISVIARGIKQREDASELFKKASRQDLVDVNDYEIATYKVYQPTPLSSEELSQIVDQVIVESGAKSIKQMGMVMGKVVLLTKGKADGKTINQIVRDKLPKE